MSIGARKSAQDTSIQAVTPGGHRGYFWFFEEDNVEVVLKVLDACSFTDRFWVFAAGLLWTCRSAQRGSPSRILAALPGAEVNEPSASEAERRFAMRRAMGASPGGR